MKENFINDILVHTVCASARVESKSGDYRSLHMSNGCCEKQSSVTSYSTKSPVLQVMAHFRIAHLLVRAVLMNEKLMFASHSSK